MQELKTSWPLNKAQKTQNQNTKISPLENKQSQRGISHLSLYVAVSLIPNTLHLAPGLKAVQLQLCHRAHIYFIGGSSQYSNPLLLLNTGIKFVLLVVSYKHFLPKAHCQQEKHTVASSAKHKSFNMMVLKRDSNRPIARH